jgi:hypothetical protein
MSFFFIAISPARTLSVCALRGGCFRYARSAAELAEVKVWPLTLKVKAR